MLKVRCPTGYGEADSIEHMPRRHALSPTGPAGDFEDIVAFLNLMTPGVARNGPALPAPIEEVEKEEEEISVEPLDDKPSLTSRLWSPW